MSRDHADVWSMLRAESQIWAIEPSRLSGMVALMARNERVAAAAQPASPLAGVAVINILGPLVRNGGMLADYFALSSYSGIRASLHQALADRSVNRIILNVDSPGGAASGCEELAADLASAARVKPMTTFVAGLAASAGYWLASQAPQITMTPSGEVGSIGVLLLHVDISRALDAAGVTPSFIVSKASPFKVEGNQFEPLGAPARAHQQEAVDMIADRFIAAVASGRRVTSAKVRSDFGRGRTLMANAAHAAGMVDRVGTLRDALGIGATQASPAAFMTERQQIAAARQRRMEAALTPRERLVQARRRRLIIEGLA